VGDEFADNLQFVPLENVEITPQIGEPQIAGVGNADFMADYIYCNYIRIAFPQPVLSFVITEYNNSPTDYSIMTLKSNPGGPFAIQVTAAPTNNERDLQLQAVNIRLKCDSTGCVYFNTNNVDQWAVNPNGALIPVTNNTNVLGDSTHNILQINAGHIQLNQASTLWSGVGAPSAATGANGDIFFNTTGAALTTIYQKRSGAWVGIV